jgi:2-amino-4-hydroxy-6-hydroxymethyldihydropteridine diphosphokinase
LKTAYLSLGSNVGDREGQLRATLARLELAEVHVAKKSQVYETEPQDVLDQPWFLNLAVEVETDLFPMQLLSRLQKIERDLGRKRLRPGGPRTVDIDILFYGRFVIRTPQIEIPHRRVGQRRFVLEPLAEIAPDLRHPVTGQTVREMLAEIQGQRVRASGVIL